MNKPADILPKLTYDEELTKYYMSCTNTKVAPVWLDKEYYESRITEEVLALWWKNTHLNMVIQDWYDHVYLPSLPPPPPSPPALKRERTTFVKALEDAFWEAGGPAILIQLAEDNPLEFLKICAKLIPTEMGANAERGNLAISFNITAPPAKVEGAVYDQ